MPNNDPSDAFLAAVRFQGGPSWDSVLKRALASPMTASTVKSHGQPHLITGTGQSFANSQSQSPVHVIEPASQQPQLLPGTIPPLVGQSSVLMPTTVPLFSSPPNIGTVPILNAAALPAQALPASAALSVLGPPIVNAVLRETDAGLIFGMPPPAPGYDGPPHGPCLKEYLEAEKLEKDLDNDDYRVRKAAQDRLIELARICPLEIERLLSRWTQAAAPEVRGGAIEVLRDPCVQLELQLVKAHSLNSTTAERTEALKQIAELIRKCPDGLERFEQAHYTSTVAWTEGTEPLWFPLLALALGVIVEGDLTGRFTVTTDRKTMQTKIADDPCKILEILTMPHDLNNETIVFVAQAGLELHKLCELKKKPNLTDDDRKKFKQGVEGATDSLLHVMAGH
jgi:hypothetical protein